MYKLLASNGAVVFRPAGETVVVTVEVNGGLTKLPVRLPIKKARAMYVALYNAGFKPAK